MVKAIVMSANIFYNYYRLTILGQKCNIDLCISNLHFSDKKGASHQTIPEILHIFITIVLLEVGSAKLSLWCFKFQILTFTFSYEIEENAKEINP